MQSSLLAIFSVLLAVQPGTAEERVITFAEPVQRFELLGHAAVASGPGGSRRVAAPGLLPPGSPGTNPFFVESGFIVEAFWAVHTGSPGGHFVRGHFHPADLFSGFEAQHWGGGRELHGIFIRAADGRPFSVRSLKYRVTMNRELGKNNSIESFSRYEVNVLMATDFSPTRSVRAQFFAFPVGPPSVVDTNEPFRTLVVAGFDDVSQVFIASSGSVDFDDIILDQP